MRSWRATHNLLAVSANTRETAINKEQALDTSLLVNMDDVINLEPRREDNADELTGKEEADTIYDLGNLVSSPLTFNKAQAQHLAFIFAYALGTTSTGAAGAGYEHTITPIDGDVDAYRSVPSFTGAMRLGKTVLKRRFASMFVDSFVATFARDDWVKIVGQTKGTGKVTDNVYEETLAALDDAVSLTLATNGVEGADAQARLDNVQRIRVELATGVWTEVAYSVVSDATPAVITIADPGGAGVSKNYKILYIPDEVIPSDWQATNGYSVDDICKPTTPNDYWYICTVAGTSSGTEPAVWPTTIGETEVDGSVTWECITDAWMTFPSRVVETPLRCSEVTFKLGGKWDGSDFQGGREMDAEVQSIEWTFNDNLEVIFSLGAGGAYANRCFRPARTQILKLDREFRDYIIQNHIDENDDFGIEILAEGAIYDTPHKYQSRIVFPKVAILSAPLSHNNKRIAEVGDMVILEDDTYGSVITKTKNLQSTYAA